MTTIHTLQPGRHYRVVREFVDYDGQLHPVGETWEFVETNFVPYYDGLTLHVLVHGLPCIYRLHYVPEGQQELITHFSDYVVPC